MTQFSVFRTKWYWNEKRRKLPIKRKTNKHTKKIQSNFSFIFFLFFVIFLGLLLHDFISVVGCVCYLLVSSPWFRFRPEKHRRLILASVADTGSGGRHFLFPHRNQQQLICSTRIVRYEFMMGGREGSTRRMMNNQPSESALTRLINFNQLLLS